MQPRNKNRRTTEQAARSSGEPARSSGEPAPSGASSQLFDNVMDTAPAATMGEIGAVMEKKKTGRKSDTRSQNIKNGIEKPWTKC